MLRGLISRRLVRSLATAAGSDAPKAVATTSAEIQALFYKRLQAAREQSMLGGGKERIAKQVSATRLRAPSVAAPAALCTRGTPRKL